MKKYLRLDQLSEGELRRVARRARWILIRRWLRHNPHIIIVSAVWIGLLPMALQAGLFAEWIGISAVFTCVFLAQVLPHKQKVVYHKKDTGPLG